MMKSDTLTFRLIALSCLWIVPAMVLSAVIIFWSYHGHVLEHLDEHALGHLKELVNASRFGADGGYQLTRAPGDPHFQNPESGWYWQISTGEQVLARSPSLGSHTLEIHDFPTGDSVVVLQVTGKDEPLRAQILRIETTGDEPITFVTTVPREMIVEDVRNFGLHIAVSFAVLTVGLLLALVVQVRSALKPLRRLGHEISDIRSGSRQSLSSDFPLEVQPLANELNNFIEHNTVVLTRARNQLGDLAHAVKNPLAVINNEVAKLRGETGSIILDQTRSIRASIEHHLSRARTFGRADALGKHTDVCTVVDDLLLVMRHTFKSRNLEFEVSLSEKCHFRGDSQDLEDMIGNLLDNACKWARSKVGLRCVCRDRRMTLTVEDDGPGIPPEFVGRAVHRGWKEDDSRPGHGLGLAIVNELVDLYGGKLELGKSRSGGLRAELELPAV